jgi:hypothetical protein
MTIARRQLAGLVLLVALVACGGGGGGSSAPPLTDSDPGTNTGGINPGSNTGSEPVPGGPVASDQGVEFRVNASTALSQETPAMARLPDGGYVVAWSTRVRGSPPSVPVYDAGNGILAQRFGADGAPVGGEKLIDPLVAGRYGERPRAAALNDGGYIVAWTTHQSDGWWGSQLERIRPDGSRGYGRQDPFQELLDVTGTSDGGYVVLFGVRRAGEGAVTLFTQRYSEGNVQSSPQQVSEIRAIRPFVRAPVIRALADGTLLVAWSAPSAVVDVTDNNTDIYTRRLNADGSPAGAERPARGDSWMPDIAALKGGGYVMTWALREKDSPAGTQYMGSSYVLAQAFRSDGSPTGSATRVDPATDLPNLECVPPPSQHSCVPFPLQFLPVVAGLEDGGFVIAWLTPDRPGGVYARRFDVQGAPIGAVTRATSTTAFQKNTPAVTSLGNGGFVVGWKSEGEDGDLGGIYARQWGAMGLR